MALFLILLVILAVVVLFAVQNSAPVTIAFLSWRFEASLAIVIFLSVLAGALAASVVASVRGLRKRRRKEAPEKTEEASKSEDKPSVSG